MRNSPAVWDLRARTIESSAEACGWSERSQEKRFRTVYGLIQSQADFFPETDAMLDFGKVLDFGCGTGAFIENFTRMVDYEYFGYDWSPEMRARARADHPRAVILDELDEDLVFDHVVCIGVFNLEDNWSKEQTWETLTELWAMHTRRSLVVSLMRWRVDLPEGMLGYHVDEVARFVEALGYERPVSFALRGDHLPNDLILGAFYEPGRDRAPAELPAGDVGHQQDPRG